ncbi:hypothetical protein Pint_12562 [Pistacia integerrima]|uniref:Uncharacterized protein n=1 Tax=Pistacia integerrima TaxID=434235 RepID=A0ACC0Y948_9ROSI|nr:hypothetical protein Pint_12562 [Pistacia integerrima]
MRDFLRFLANFGHLLRFCFLFFSLAYGATELADDRKHAVEVKRHSCLRHLRALLSLIKQQQQFAFLKYPSLLRDPDGCNRYFINLVGITIGQKRLQMPFSNDGSSSQIAIIDSGTLVSRLC